ncbi:hypothetical protein GCM10010508_54630 [Streptomyces naganishii JCM 4654]|uniref:Uncharacterized protein n=1 Tax=Streptomyces naganishii JCM 4654 TaxID=1306179 RepID=A0A918Y8J8_9ACTN|nr:hypothetical protein GCM10010508_54630 [Streptomyces naganishii JCM 4654]
MDARVLRPLALRAGLRRADVGILLPAWVQGTRPLRAEVGTRLRPQRARLLRAQVGCRVLRARALGMLGVGGRLLWPVALWAGVGVRPVWVLGHRARVVRHLGVVGGWGLPRGVGRWQRRTHCVLHPVPLRLVCPGRSAAALGAGGGAGPRSLPNGTVPGRRMVNGPGHPEVPTRAGRSGGRATGTGRSGGGHQAPGPGDPAGGHRRGATAAAGPGHRRIPWEGRGGSYCPTSP